MRVKDLYGEEGEIILSQLERRENDFLTDLELKEAIQQQNKNLIQIEHMGEMT